MIFRVLVDDNFHYMDESERYEHGTFQTLEAALEAARLIVDRSLFHLYRPGMNAKALYDSYQCGGDDSYIEGTAGEVFSAWTYAEIRAAEICASPIVAPEISRFYGISIGMAWRAFAVPHFRARYREDEGEVRIHSGELRQGRLPDRALRLVREWLDLHRAELLANWERSEKRESLRDIPPLDQELKGA